MSWWIVFSTLDSQVFSKLNRSKTFRSFWCCLQWVPFCAMDTPGKVQAIIACSKGGGHLYTQAWQETSILDIFQSTFCRWCRDGIPWLASAADIAEVSVHSTPTHLFFTFLPKLLLLFFQLPQLLGYRLAGTQVPSQVLYCLVFALLQHFHRVILSLHCTMWCKKGAAGCI